MEPDFRALADSDPDGVYVFDREGRYVYINEAVTQLAGLRWPDVRGKHYLEAFPDMRGEPFDVAFAKVLATGGPLRFDYHYKPWDRWFANEMVPLGDFVCVRTREITDTKRLQAEIEERRLRERNQRILSTAGEQLGASLEPGETLNIVSRLAVGVLGNFCAIDLKTERGIERVKVEFDDAALAARSKAIDLNRAGGEHPIAKVRDLGKTLVLREWTEALMRKVAVSAEHLDVMRAVGEGSLVTAPLIARGELLGCITFLWVRNGRRHTDADVTLAEELARRMALALDNARRYERERQAVQLAEMFIGIIGHDLRTPLAAIAAAAQVIEHGGAPPQKYAARIVTSAKRMAQMISDLLDFSRMRLGGGLQLSREEGDVVEIWRDVADELATSHPARIEVSHDGDGQGFWDRGRLAQLASNLIGNALQHGEAGGKVRVAIDCSPREIRLSVRNSGAPIPEDVRRGLFQPFRGSRAGGLGLGLYIAEQIAQLHGGSIDVDSAGSETVFEVRLPRDLNSSPR